MKRKRQQKSDQKGDRTTEEKRRRRENIPNLAPTCWALQRGGVLESAQRPPRPCSRRPARCTGAPRGCGPRARQAGTDNSPPHTMQSAAEEGQGAGWHKGGSAESNQSSRKWLQTLIPTGVERVNADESGGPRLREMGVGGRMVLPLFLSSTKPARGNLCAEPQPQLAQGYKNHQWRDFRKLNTHFRE